MVCDTEVFSLGSVTTSYNDAVIFSVQTIPDQTAFKKKKNYHELRITSKMEGTNVILFFLI